MTSDLPSAAAEAPSSNRRGPNNRSAGPTIRTAGRWVVLHGAVLRSTGDVRVAVIVEPAHPARLTELMSAYALTGREREVTRLVLQGASTAEILGTCSCRRSGSSST